MPAKHLLATLFALCLAGCGKPLGEYRFDSARVVPGDALSRVDPAQYLAPFDHDLIRIEFSSETDLEALATGDLYLHGDFCPFKEEYALGIFGPFYNDRSRYVATADEAADAGVAGVRNDWTVNGKPEAHISYPNRHPRKDQRTGRYLYTAYLKPYDRPARPAGHGMENHPYDLRSDHRDLCLRIDSPGYNVTPYRSKQFTIPGTAIAAALRARTSH